ncbi:hypothetical protein FO519_008221 [Halicephalobus sp. NKZ332]|nr:hypothetical protein FO519_008221 [Halicephalobus sp. NKZ332]
MEAAVVHRFGDVKNIRIEKNWPIPDFTDTQVLVKVKASAVNPVDTYIRSGNYANLPKLPYIPGREGAGIIEKVGSGVKNVAPGDRVWFSTPVTGSASTYSVVESTSVFPLPENISFVEGSTLGIAYLTAFRALFVKAKARPGESIFVHGASGGVGLAAVQLGKAYNLKVYGTAGTTEGMEVAKSQGADFMINHNEDNYVDKILEEKPEGFDIVLEMLANVNLNHDLCLVAKFGRICVIGNRGQIQIDPRRLMQKESSVVGVFLAHTSPQEMEEMGTEIVDLLRSKKLKPVIDLELPLNQLDEAHKQVIEKSSSKGKIVINLDIPNAN